MNFIKFMQRLDRTWARALFDYVSEKSETAYEELVLGSVVSIGSPEAEGVAFKVGYLFDEATGPQQMRESLALYDKIKALSSEYSVSLLAPKGVVRQGILKGNLASFTEEMPFRDLAIGFVGKRPSHVDIDRLFQMYNKILE
jgi:hypothetical protein